MEDKIKIMDIGDKFPDLLGRDADGKEVRLSDFPESTILYTACNTIDKIIGIPIDNISRFTGIVPILFFDSFSFITTSC